MENRSKLWVLLLVLVSALASLFYWTRLEAQAYQPVALREFTETEKARVYLLEKLNNDVKKFNQLSRIISAESNWRIDAYNPATRDVGLLQINLHCHLEKSRELGMDIYTYQGNIDYGVYLYEKEGLRPWSASKHKWSKNQ